MKNILDKCLRREALTREEAYRLYDEAPLPLLARTADEVRRSVVPDPGVVTWQIDRNVNITNVCISGCRFCNFHCKPHQEERAYITTLGEYRTKIARTLELGGDQLLLQGGLHPKLDIGFYEQLFRDLKAICPTLKLHALGAPEVAHIARISGLSTCDTLRRLMAAGLDSLPGAGAEILDPEVRRALSPAKPSVEEWLRVMHEAHMLNLPTSATMMYGHIETPHQRVDHLLRIRDLQAQCPPGHHGFIAFIPWIFRSAGTELERQGVVTRFSPLEYVRLIAVSRLVLHNIDNIQASWLTVGKQTAQVALHSGANDMGSIMIEENVVSSAGAHNRFDAAGIQQAIREAGFTPRLRDQCYECARGTARFDLLTPRPPQEDAATGMRPIAFAAIAAHAGRSLFQHAQQQAKAAARRPEHPAAYRNRLRAQPAEYTPAKRQARGGLRCKEAAACKGFAGTAPQPAAHPESRSAANRTGTRAAEVPLRGSRVPQQTPQNDIAPGPATGPGAMHRRRRGSDRRRDKEHGGYRKDGVQLGESRKNQRLTHHVVAVADGSDAVGAHLGLVVRREEADQTREHAGAEDGGTLEQRHRLGEEALDNEVADEAVEALRTRNGRQDHVAAESAAVLLHGADRRLTGDRGADTARNARKAHHQCYAHVAQNNCSCCLHSSEVFLDFV